MRRAVAEKVRVGPPQIQTPEDARMAYLREEITEKELEEILGKFGVSGANTGLYFLPEVVTRVDDGFKRSLPDDPQPKRDSYEERKKFVDNRTKEREAATKASEKVSTPSSKTVVTLDKEALAEQKNEAADKAASRVTKSTAK